VLTRSAAVTAEISCQASPATTSLTAVRAVISSRAAQAQILLTVVPAEISPGMSDQMQPYLLI